MKPGMMNKVKRIWVINGEENIYRPLKYFGVF